MERCKVLCGSCQQHDDPACSMLADQRANQELVINPCWHGNLHIRRIAGVATPKRHFAMMTPGYKALQVPGMTIVALAKRPRCGFFSTNAHRFETRALRSMRRTNTC